MSKMANHTDLANRSNARVEAVQQRESVAPAVDVYENSDELLLLVDVPGASNEGIDVQLDKGQLTISAKRREDAPGSLLAGEYRTRDYLRVFSVPQGIDSTKIDAQLSGGVLRLKLPKSDSVKPRRIEVKQG
jgi:HSP20 family molecular chaperone IbpA